MSDKYNNKQESEKEQPPIDLIGNTQGYLQWQPLNLDKLIPKPGTNTQEIRFKREVNKQLKRLHELEELAANLMPDKMKRERQLLEQMDEETKQEMLELDEFAQEKEKIKNKMEKRK